MTRARADYELAATDKTGAAFASVDRRLEASRQSLTRMAALTSTIGLAGAASFARFATRVSETGDQLQKATIRTGIAAEELSALQLVAKLNDVSAETLGTAIFRMNRNLQEGADGAKEQAEALSRLGLDAQALLRMDPAQRFLTIAEALNQSATDGELAADGQAIFGRAVEDLIPLIRQGREAIEEYTEGLRDNPLWTTEQTEAAMKIQDDFTEIGATLERESARVLPFFEKITNAANQGLSALSERANGLTQIARDIQTLPFDLALDAITDDADTALQRFGERAARALKTVGLDDFAADMEKATESVDAAVTAAAQVTSGDYIDPLSIALDAIGLTPGAGTPEARDPGGVVAVVRQAMQLLASGPGMMEGAPGSVGMFGQVDRNRFVAGADALARPQKVEDPEQRRVLEEIRDILRQNGASDTRTAVFA